MSFAGATITPDHLRFVGGMPLAGFGRVMPQRGLFTQRQVQTQSDPISTLTLHDIRSSGVHSQPLHEAPHLAVWKRIRAFTGLDAGWKGPGSIPVPQAAIDDAELFTLAVMKHDTIEPDFVGAAADGELMITWRAPNLFIDVGFHGSGTYSVYADISGNEHLEDDRSANQPLPAHVLKVLFRTVGQR